MKVSATAKNVGVSARKARLILDQVKGQRVSVALFMLGYLPSPSAKEVAKVVKSAASNAENTYNMLPASLKVVLAYADEGKTLRRFRPRSRGRTSPILKRSSHITVVVDEER